MNPIKQARLERGMTQKELAKLAGITPHGLLRYEQGLYENISPNLLVTCAEHLDTSRAILESEYDAFRYEVQVAARSLMLKPVFITITPDSHPFVTFRDCITTRAVGRSSRIRFCILLAINPAVVLNYDKGKQGPMPGLIREALKNAGLHKDYIERLDIYGQLWHERYGC